MKRMFIENLTRQLKGFQLLKDLLEEEYSHLRALEPQDVSSLELSIQELLHQLAAERNVMVQFLQGMRITEWVQTLPMQVDSEGRPVEHTQEEIDLILNLTNAIDGLEQTCAKQAELNTTLALALMDQSASMLDFLQDQITPKQKEFYSARGAYQNNRPQASLIQGKL